MQDIYFLHNFLGILTCNFLTFSFSASKCLCLEECILVISQEDKRITLQYFYVHIMLAYFLLQFLVLLITSGMASILLQVALK